MNQSNDDKKTKNKRSTIALHRRQASEKKRQVELIRVIIKEEPKLAIKLIQHWLKK